MRGRFLGDAGPQAVRRAGATIGRRAANGARGREHRFGARLLLRWLETLR